MKTLSGIIAATTRIDYWTPSARSDLFVEPWFFHLTSRPYITEVIEASGATAEVSRASYLPYIAEGTNAASGGIIAGSLT